MPGPADDLNQLTKNPTPSFDDVVEEFEEKQSDYQAAYNAGGRFKEQLEAIASGWKKEDLAVPSKGAEVKEVAEIPDHPEISPEVEGYVERVEKDPQMQKALADDYVKQVGMASTTPQNTTVKLPLTQDQIKQGLQHRVWESVRWLAEWCLRQLKMLSLKRA